MQRQAIVRKPRRVKTVQGVIREMDDMQLSKFSMMDSLSIVQYFGRDSLESANSIRILIEREQVRRQNVQVA